MSWHTKKWGDTVSLAESGQVVGILKTEALASLVSTLLNRHSTDTGTTGESLLLSKEERDGS